MKILKTHFKKREEIKIERGSWMKKRIELGIVIVLLMGIGVYFFFLRASVDKPVVVSAQMNEKNQEIAISYITTKRDQTLLTKVTVGEKSFYPIETSKESDASKILASQNGYQLREDVIKLTEKELTYFMELSGRVPPVSVSYKEYAPIETILVVLKEGEAAEGIIEEDTLRYTFTANEPMDIATMGHYDSFAFLRASGNGGEPTLSAKLKKGESIDVIFSEPYKLASNDELLLEIQTADGKNYIKHLETTLEIPEGYLKQIVAEYQ